MAGRKGTAVLLAIASSALLLVAVPEAISEAKALVASLQPAATRSAAIAAGERQPGSSYISRNDYFRSCLDVPASLAGLLRPAEERLRLLEACRDSARDEQVATPTYALPYLVEATTTAALGEPFAAPLSRARALAPHLHWQVDRRVVLARAQMARLDAAGREAFDRDLLELFSSAEGRRALAMHFIRWPDIRERLTALAETVPDDAQKDFLAEVRRESGEAR